MQQWGSEATKTLGYARDDALADPAWLHDRLDDPAVRVVEVDVSAARYDEGHVDGAVLWNVYRDLKDSHYRPVDQESVERLLDSSGITPGSTVVFYGYAPAMGVWLLNLYGHTDARVLNCSREAWAGQGRPWTARASTERTTEAASERAAGKAARQRAGYRLPEGDARLRASLATVQAAVASQVCQIVDVRSDLEYRGERFWPSGGSEPGGRAGHIPTATHLPIEALHDERGAFRSATELGDVFAPIDPTGQGEVITYCTIGGRACTAWFTLTHLLGRDNVSVYDGSWAEWGLTADTPVARG